MDSGASAALQKNVREQKTQHSIRKKLLRAALFVPVLFAIGIYLYFTVSYSNRFLPNTRLGNFDISGMTAPEAEQLLQRATDTYNLTLRFRDDQKETISGSAIDYQCVSVGRLQKLMESQDSFTWIWNLFSKERGQHQAVADFSGDALKAILSSLPECKEENMAAPEDAHPEFKDGTFVVEPEVLGTTLRSEDVYEAASNAVTKGRTAVDLEDCY